jgi:hypothetical protein
MDATLILIDSDDELLRARALVDQLWNSNDPANVARLEAQARLIAAYEEIKWRRPPSADLIATLMDPGQCRDFVACSMSDGACRPWLGRARTRSSNQGVDRYRREV